MFIEYKFFKQKRKLYQQIALTNHNEDQDKLDRLKENNSQNDEQAYELINPNIKEQSIELMHQNESPLYILDDFYPDCYPVFGYDFIIDFSEYYRQEGPDCEYLLSKIVFSDKRNAYQFANVSILDCLFLRLPYTFEIILEIMKSNKIFVDHFTRSGGLYLLIHFSNNTDSQFIVAQIFLYISANSQIDLEQNALPPVCIDDDEEYNFITLFQNLLFSDNSEVQICCLKSIEQLFSENCSYQFFNIGSVEDYEPETNENKSLENILVEMLYDLLQDKQYEHLMSYVFNAAFFLNVGTFTKDFINTCHLVFHNENENCLEPALFFISQNMRFICSDEDISSLVFDDLFVYIEKGTFFVSKIAIFDMISFLSKCKNIYYEQSFENGVIQSVSNILFTMDQKIEEKDDFEFVIFHLKIFLENLIDSGVRFDISEQVQDLQALVSSLQLFLSYPDDSIISKAKDCISIINQILGVEEEGENLDPY